jgi:sialic acid synthase SpsE/sugar phosphate isomerase/epimerase
MVWVDRLTQSRIIAEIGINHNGSPDTARALIDAAADAGVWGLKFQYRNLANAYANDARQIGDEILQNEIRRNYLPPAQIIALSQHARARGIEPGISFFTPDDVADFGQDIEVFGFFKIPSVEFTNLALIKRIEALGKYGLISTGAYTEAAIRRVLAEVNRARWVPLHCVSNYPVGIPNPKLGYISHLRDLWGAPVGYSSHDEYWETCLLALQLGASVIERHITFDKAADGLDHSSSSTPDEFKKLVRFAENMALILAGSGPRIPNQGELLNLQNLGRSFYAKSEIAVGQAVTAENVVLRSPRTGLGQEEIGDFLGHSAMRPVAPGAVIDRSVFEKPETLSSEDLEFARRKKLSLPVRFHDLAHIEARIPLGHYEFHLSFGDIERTIDTKTLNSKNRYSVHLPDYVSPTQLMDPFAPLEEQRRASLRVLERTAAFTKALQDRTGAQVPVVGSFSVVHAGLADFFDRHAELLSAYRTKGVDILPQWLPPIAWYFGGAVRLEAMNNVGDVAHIKRLQLPICMDICHLCMGDKVFDFKAGDVVRELAPMTHHVHIADASGYDGEGVAFGTGDAENRDAIAAALSLDCVKVIEVWQGHLHGGAGFVKAVKDLRELFHDA